MKTTLQPVENKLLKMERTRVKTLLKNKSLKVKRKIHTHTDLKEGKRLNSWSSCETLPME